MTAALASARRPSPHLHKEATPMHELSIAMSIVDVAEEQIKENGGSRVNAVHLKLGMLSGVVKEALLSSYELACEGTPLAGSRLMIEEVPVIAFCPKCDASHAVN